MTTSELKKNAAPWFVLVVISLALASSPTLMRACFQADPAPDAPAPFWHR
jgi:hypothetical protein